MRIKDSAPRRNRIEPLLPMIDVVFFLVVFFMIVSRLADPEPFAVARPAASGAAETRGEFGLFLSATGDLGFVGPQGPILGEAALAALLRAKAASCAAAACVALPPVLLIHADSAAPADRLVQLLPRLTAAGFGEVSLLTVAK
jgi:biopolymer transport protein ExbD